jgi:DNA (cytosine-5)-methyltransferase 1
VIYYNDNDPYCCRWLQNLINAGLLPDGFVDERPIQNVEPEDLEGFTQCHFFAGIGGWPLALRMAGWPEDRPVWTGSCPCQPFSVAGKRKGTADERHLWPYLYWLIAKSKRTPATVFGEQVAAAADWLAGVRSDLEALGYAVGAIPIEAACAGAAQYRDRFWFVAKQQVQPERETEHEICTNAWQESRSDGGGNSAGRDLRLLAGNPLKQVGATGFTRQHCNVVRPPLDGWGQGWTESEFRSRGFTAAVASTPDSHIQFILCPDGKFRRLPPPRVRWLGNGISAHLVRMCAGYLFQATERIIVYGEKCNKNGPEVLRMVRTRVQQEERRTQTKNLGVPTELPEAEILFSFLRCVSTALHTAHIGSRLQETCLKITRSEMRCLRPGTPYSSSPCRWEPIEQQSGESSDSLLLLSLFLARNAEAYWDALRKANADIVNARVAKLRALGNAIYPPLAAQVIRAYMETEEHNF